MLILGIETSGKVASVAVSDNLKIISEVTLNTKLVHSVMLMDLIDTSLKNPGLSIDDIDIFACSIGPGSFTGLRIGVSTIKAFSYAKDKKCIGVNSLEALCYNAFGTNKYIIPVIDAKSNMLFSAVYRFEDDALKTYENVGIYSIEEINKFTEKYKDYVLIGEGIDVYMFENLNKVPEFIRYQKASNVCIKAFELYNEGKSISHFDLNPLYLKKSYAEKEKSI
ncbi:tRNA (adenosine(37)-N6)-threonylcarbamoyltransferase complex dimerization subunit type 1 TsaB [Caldicellulosiruptoraceae bacterium PP1]